MLLTDSPEILPAVELFNASGIGRPIELRYAENLPEALLDIYERKETPPSIVLGRYLPGPSLAPTFAVLDRLFSDVGRIDPDFYDGLAEGGMSSGKPVLLPVSFNATLVIDKKGQSLSPPADRRLEPLSTISIDTLAKNASAFDKTGKSGSRMGFSPRWPGGDILFSWMRLKGADFEEGPISRDRRRNVTRRAILQWNPEGVDAAVSSLIDFTASINGSPGEEDAFAFTYLSAPAYRNVESGRVLFAAMESSDFFILPSSVRAGFEFRFFAEGGSIAVADDARYAGIPSRAPNAETAKRFLRWLFTDQNQKAILERSRSLRMSESSFGIAGGFSSMRSVTESVFPDYYPDLLGRLPPPDYVDKPPTLPPAWPRLKRDFILPWLAGFLSDKPESSASENLANGFDAYLAKNPDLR